jgi:hypothetical protein
MTVLVTIVAPHSPAGAPQVAQPATSPPHESQAATSPPQAEQPESHAGAASHVLQPESHAVSQLLAQHESLRNMPAWAVPAKPTASSATADARLVIRLIIDESSKNSFTNNMDNLRYPPRSSRN